MKKMFAVLSALIILAASAGLVFAEETEETPLLNAYLAETEVVLDGDISGLFWADPLCFGDDTDETGGCVYALWQPDALYLALEYANASSAVITLGEKTWNIDLQESIAAEGLTGTAVDGVAELKFDLQAAALVPADFYQKLALAINLNGENGSSAVNAALVFTGAVAQRQPWVKQASGDSATYSTNISSYVEGDTAAFGGLTGAYFVRSGITEIDHSKDLVLRQKLSVVSMPVTTGGFNSGAYAVKNGYSFWISDNEDGNSGIMMFANLYNDGTQLVLQFRHSTAATTFSAVPLGKAVGDTFVLETLWHADSDRASVYVDGAYVGTAENLNFTGKGGGKNAISNRYTGATTAQIEVSEQTLSVVEYTSVQQELTVNNLLPGVDLLRVSENLTLPGTYQSEYLGLLELSWLSSDEATLDTDGQVSQPQGALGRYAELTLLYDGHEMWTEDVFVLPSDPYVQKSPEIIGAAFTQTAVTPDNVLDEEGWTLNTAVYSAEGSVLGTMGVQWDMENLYLAIRTGGNAAALTLNDIPVTLPDAAEDVVEAAVALQSLNVTVKNYGVEIPAKLCLGSCEWEGTIVLTSTDWYITDSTDPGTTATGGTLSMNGSAVTADASAVHTEDGWHFYDRYARDGSNTGYIRTYRQFSYAELGDRTKGTYMEFDLLVNSMPEFAITSWSGSFASYGLTWSIVDSRDAEGYTNSVLAGVVNTEDGLALVVKGDGILNRVFSLGRNVGQQFRLGTCWEANGDLSVYVDGELLAVAKNATLKKAGLGSNCVMMSLIRDNTAPSDKNDDMDVWVKNMSLGQHYGTDLWDSLTFETIAGENENAFTITSNLELPALLTNTQLTGGIGLTWSSSAPETIAADGTVTVPQYSTVVELTATGEDGNSKCITLYVLGEETDRSVLLARNDLDPSRGSGVYEDVYPFVLDQDHNSVIFDQGAVKKVNVIALTEQDAVNRLNESVLSVWVSDDNQSYTKVDGFKLLHAGQTVYLYGFEAEGRYVKVHCTHYLGQEADFTGQLSKMIRACYEDIFGSNGGTFTETTVTVTNSSESTVYDKVFVLNTQAQRVLLDGELLYHCVEDEKTYVRVPMLEAGASAELTVLTGNAAAMDISNKEAVYEVVYGTREAAVITGPGRWITALPDGGLFAINHHDVMEGNLVLYRYLSWSRSFDGGMTWTDPTPIVCEEGAYNSSSAGVAYDPVTGRIIAVGFCLINHDADNWENSDMKLKFFYSDDLGETWHLCPDVEILGEQINYFGTYSPPTILSCNDGSGENVDMVLPTSGSRNNEYTDGRIVYSDDGGLTWTMSPSAIHYSQGTDLYHNEAGITEGTVLERDDGVLVYYARCQYGNVDHFARSYSYDQGKTWTEEAELANFYTVNTQPMAYVFGESPLMVWGGNNALGGNSYQRYPMNVGVFDKDLLDLVTIQDLYSRYSLQGMTVETMNRITNPSVASVGDTLTISWWANSGRLIMRVDDFTDYLYRTKGAYDSFETATTKYEGWSTILGTVSVNSDIAYQGSRSMQIVDGSSAVRSIPYVQDGSVSFMLYLDDLDGTLQIELESAYSDVFGEAAPIALEVADGKLNGLSLKEGWNKVTFDLALTEGSASLTVNGETAQLTPDTNIGDYICYVEIGNGTTVCYVDEFTVVDNDPQTVPEAPETPIPQRQPEIAYNSVSLKGNIGVNYYMTLPADVLAEEDAYMEFTVAGKTPVKIPVADAIEETVDGKTYYVFTCQVAAKEMTDIINARFVYSGGAVQAKEFSVRAYADTILEDETGNYDSVKPLVEAMLQYGAYAQLHFGYNADDLANEGLDAAAIDTVTAQTLAGFAGSGSESAFYRGNSLLLKSETSLRFFFQVAEGETLNATCNGKPLAATERGGMQYVAIENIAAKDLDTAYTLDVDGNEITASALTYAYNVLSAADGTYTDDLENLVKALYLYNQAANDYFPNN